MKMNETTAAILVSEHALDTAVPAVARKPVWMPVYCYSGYSGRFECVLTMVVFENTNTGKHSCQPFSDGQSLGNPFVCNTLEQAKEEAHKAF